jgi:hypothetical protein
MENQKQTEFGNIFEYKYFAFSAEEDFLIEQMVKKFETDDKNCCSFFKSKTYLLQFVKKNLI